MFTYIYRGHFLYANFSLLLIFWKNFSLHRCWILLKTFFASIGMITQFFLVSLWIWWITFSSIKLVLHPWNKLHLVMIFDFLICCWIVFATILLRICTSPTEELLVCGFSFLYCLWFWYRLPKMNWEVFPPLLFSGTDCREWVFSFPMQAYVRPLFETCLLLSHRPRQGAWPRPTWTVTRMVCLQQAELELCQQTEWVLGGMKNGDQQGNHRGAHLLVGYLDPQKLFIPGCKHPHACACGAFLKPSTSDLLDLPKGACGCYLCDIGIPSLSTAYKSNPQCGNDRRPSLQNNQWSKSQTL